MVTESQKRAKAKYDLKTTQYVFRLRNDADADIIAKLKSVGSKTEYLRTLIRSDIENER